MKVSLLRTVRAESWNPGLRFLRELGRFARDPDSHPPSTSNLTFPCKISPNNQLYFCTTIKNFEPTNQSQKSLDVTHPTWPPGALLPVSISSHCPFNKPLRPIPGPLLPGVFRSANPTAWVRGPAPTPETAGVSPGPRRHICTPEKTRSNVLRATLVPS